MIMHGQEPLRPGRVGSRQDTPPEWKADLAVTIVNLQEPGHVSGYLAQFPTESRNQEVCLSNSQDI